MAPFPLNDPYVDFVYLLAWLAIASFPVAYSRTRWWITRTGRAMMARGAAFLILFTGELLNRAFDWEEVGWIGWIRLVTLLIIASSSMYLTWDLLRIQHQGVRNDRRSNDLRAV